MIYQFGDHFLEDFNLNRDLYLAKNSKLPEQNENCLW